MNNQTTKQNLELPLEAELLVPHRKPMCMIDRLVEFEDKSSVVEAHLGTESLLVGEDGRLDRVAYIELIAQSYAAMKGYKDLLQGKPAQKGFLVSVKRMELRGEAFLGDLLRVRVTTVGDVGEFTLAEGVVMRGDEVLAAGSLTLWVP